MYGGKPMSEMSVIKREYKGWQNCVEVSNGIVDLIATTDVGPRIIRFGFVGKENEFHEFSEDMGKTGGEKHRFYGGHRFWHAPEHPVRTYQPDNEKVAWEKKKSGIVLTQNTESLTGIKKEVEIKMAPDSAKVTVLHRLTNMGLWEVELAPWALTMMAVGGTEVIPLNTRQTGLLPNGNISLWPYSGMNDKRVYWGEKYIMLTQDENIDRSFKIGLANESGWAAYANHGRLFVIRFEPHEYGFEYPDYNCSYESYTDARFLEMETLGPLTLLAPGEAIEHIETWYLYDNVEKPANENDIENNILPLVQK